MSRDASIAGVLLGGLLLAAGCLVWLSPWNQRSPADNEFGKTTDPNRAGASNGPSNSAGQTNSDTFPNVPHLQVNEPGSNHPAPQRNGSNEPQVPPNPQQLPTLPSVPLPPVSWDTSSEEYERLAADQTASEFMRADAARKSRFRFAQWRGRQGNQLGGFDLRQEAIPALTGWTCDEGPVEAARGTAPTWVRKSYTFGKNGAWVDVDVWVALSAGWAQQLLLAQWSSVSNSLAHDSWGDLHGIEVGDAWFGDYRLSQVQLVNEGEFDFTRRNVRVRVGLRSGTADPAVSVALFSLGRELDAQIKEQGHAASDWEDIAQWRPVISRFDAKKLSLRASSPADQTEVLFEVSKPESTIFLASREVPLEFFVQGASGIVEAHPFARAHADKLPASARCWLIAVNSRDLLFTIAEVTFAIERP